MFVSPPPATMLQNTNANRINLNGNKNTNTNNINTEINYNNNVNNTNVPFFNNEVRSLYTTQTNVSSHSSTSSSLKRISLPFPNNHYSNSFVNTPREYTNNARDRIAQSLLPSPTPTPTQPSIAHENQSIYDISSYQSSIFSDNGSHLNNNSICRSQSLQTTIESPKNMLNQKHNNNISLPPLNFVTEVSLPEALPKSYNDMYSHDTLQSSNLLPNGRPSFTQRVLLDWELNDIRSLLIVDKLRPEWGNSIPIVHSEIPNQPNFRIVLLPRICSEQAIVDTLVSSDLYAEAELDIQFKYKSAQYIVDSMKKKLQKGVQMHDGILRLTKIEWRSIIENYLLNIAVEAQCRFDFKQRCSDFKKWKYENSLQQKNNPKRKNNLLKRTLLKNLNTTESTPAGKTKIILTKEEKSILWSQCQAQVYQRLGLDWKQGHA